MKVGTQLFWNISEFSIAPEELSALGFGDFVPRNDFRSAMIKALHKYVKGNEKLYRRFNDTAVSVSFGVFVQTANGSDLDMAKEIILSVDKKTGVASSTGEIPTNLLADYEGGKVTLNSNQIRNMVPRFIRENHGVSMRPSGGIYFVDKRFDTDVIAKLKKLFEAFPSGHGSLYTVTLHDDQGSLESIEDSIAQTYDKEIDLLLADIDAGYKKGTLTTKQVENRKADAEKILTELKLHEANLRSKADSLVARAKKVSEVLTTRIAVAEGSLVDTGDFAGMLRML
jgi:hypothetical protein